jgi:hypothetical protein
MNMASEGRRKPYQERKLTHAAERTASRAGSRRTKRHAVSAPRTRTSPATEPGADTAFGAANGPQTDVIEVAKYNLGELDDLSLSDLKVLAKEMKLKGYSKLRRLDLIEFIYTSEENVA